MEFKPKYRTYVKVWRDGDISIVPALNRRDAFDILDSMGDPSPSNSIKRLTESPALHLKFHEETKTYSVNLHEFSCAGLANEELHALIEASAKADDEEDDE